MEKIKSYKAISVGWQRCIFYIIALLPHRTHVLRLCFASFMCIGFSIKTNVYAYQTSLPAYRADGYITITPYDAVGREVPDQIIRRNFTISVQGRQWLLKSADADDSYHLCGCDGTNVYCLYLYPKAAALSVPGTISEGLYPFDPGTTLVTLPWLAFASAPYLDLLGKSNSVSTMPAPWTMPRVDPAAYIYSLEVSRLDEDPRLPQKISFRVSDTLLTSSVHSEHLNTGKYYRAFIDNRTRALIWYKDGFVGGDYVATEVTNWMGMTLPVTAELRRYAPERAGGLFEVHSLTVTNFSQSDVTSYIPTSGSIISIVDQRFQDVKSGVDYIQYQISDNKWPNKQDASLLPIKEATERQKEREQLWDEASSAKTIVLLIIGLTTIVPLSVLLWKYWIGKHRTKH
jgi:hypothetical protein